MKYSRYESVSALSAAFYIAVAVIMIDTESVNKSVAVLISVCKPFVAEKTFYGVLALLNRECNSVL